MVERLRRLLGGTDATAQAFDDARLAAMLADAGGDLDRALVMGLRELRAEAAKQVDYSIGLERESASQLFDHLNALVSEAEARVEGKARATLPGRIGTTSARVRVSW